MAEKAKKAPKKTVKKPQPPEVTDLPGKKYMRPDEVATYFNVHRSTIYLWCDHGRLEKCQLSDGVLRIPVESVRKLEADGLNRPYE